jgi:MFS family permease
MFNGDCFKHGAMTSLSRVFDRLRGINPQLKLFLAGIALMSVSGGIFETTFNNFLDDVFHVDADTRGMLELPRELPGFLTAVLAGLLCFLPETRIAGVSALAVGFGMVGIALWGTHWVSMLVLMTLWSAGMHLMMPIRSSVAMTLAHENQKGRRLGQVQGVGIAASIIGCALVWGIMKARGPDYRSTFLIGGVASLVGAIFLLAMRMPNAHLERPRFVWHREYWLYYVLAFLFGARKQIFITFGPWVLVKIFHQPATIFAQLWIVAATLGIIFQPALGRAIDRFGERCVLMTDSICVFLVCAGYGLAHLVGNREMALLLLYSCFVGDQLLFGVNMARDTYLSKIAVQPDHVSSTLALGISINHVVSMSIPTVGGILWMKYGHPSVFMGAAGVAILMLIFSSQVSTRGRGNS